MLSDAVLDSYAGDYPRGPHETIEVRRAPDGLLSITFGGVNFLMHAGSPTRFFALTTDAQCEFSVKDGQKAVSVSVGED